MPRTFRVGARVRLTDDNSGCGAKDAEGTVIGVEPSGSCQVRFDREFKGRHVWWAGGPRHDNLEPVFKVGDRVRFLPTVNPRWWFKAGQAGTIVRLTEAPLLYSVKADGGDGEAFVDAEHIEWLVDEPAAATAWTGRPTRLKVGDRVRLLNANRPRFGQVGTIVEDDGALVRPFAVEFNGLISGLTGRMWLDPDELQLADAPAQPAANAPAPAFHPGDVVRALKSAEGQFTKGKTYTVRRTIGESVMVERDDRGSTENGWHLSNFELVKSAHPAAPTPRQAIVIATVGGKPSPAPRPYVHADRASAIREAERRARADPGKEFAVYERVAASVATEPRVSTTVEAA